MNWTMDWNEWFLIISSAIALMVFWPIRKYFRPLVTLVIWLYSVTFVETIDYVLVGSPFKLYYFADNETYEISAALVHFTQYPCSSLLFLYFYDKWKLTGYKLCLYIVAWTGISLMVEWIHILNKALTYTGWKLYYSIPTYPISMLLVIAVFHFLKKHLADPMPT